MSSGRRRSSRNAVLNANGKRSAPDTWSQWRGERRSSRLGAPVDTQLDVVSSPKRARTEESTISTTSAEALSAAASGASLGESSGLKIKIHGAAAVKPTETVLEQVAGRKRSKFWYYAVEPIFGAVPPVPVGPGDQACANGGGTSGQNGHKINGDGPPHPSINRENGSTHERSLEGSLSPAPSLDSIDFT